MHWTKVKIIKELRRLRHLHAPLSYNAMGRRNQSLLSAAAYNFGSYRNAVERAGISYDHIIRRPKWTKGAIIAQLKIARRMGEDLHWSAVTARGDDLSRAAFAALQPRLFGSWDRALHAAGLDADDVGRYRKWDRNSVVFDLRSRAANQEPLNSGAVQQEDAGLHAAAARLFGSYDRALRAAQLDPRDIRQRRRWTRQDVVAGLRKAKRRKVPLTDSSIRRIDGGLYGAAVRLFGSLVKARAAAKITRSRK
jgi:hypothetical protein